MNTSLLHIPLLYEVVGNKEFKEGLVDLVFKEAKNKEEVYGNPFVKFHNSVTSIGIHIVWNCNSLTSIIIPDGVTSIEDYAFYDCSSLTSVIISKSVTFIGNSAFRNCSKLTSITIPEGVTSIGDSVFRNCSKLTSTTIPKKFESRINDIFYGVDLSKIKITYI